MGIPLETARRRSAVASALLGLTLFAATPASAHDGAPIATAEELSAAVEAAPCRNKDRLEAVQDLFREVGAREFRVERLERVDNVVAVLPGRSPERIVVGAHYDKTRNGCGAIDNWSGIVTLVQVYRTLQAIQTNKTFVFVAFGREEEGLLGSKAMTRAIPKEDRDGYCAMINVDSLGLSWPQVALNLSSKSLAEEAREVAEELDVRHDQAALNGDSDSTPFIRRGIPALTIHGLSRDYSEILHTYRDTADRVNSASLYLGYRLVLALAAEVDEASCEAWR